MTSGGAQQSSAVSTSSVRVAGKLLWATIEAGLFAGFSPMPLAM
jgi:hypothetical protein